MQSIPTPLKEKILDHFDSLIREGERLHKEMRLIHVAITPQPSTSISAQAQGRYAIDWQRFVRWRTRCLSLLGHIIPDTSIHVRTMREFEKLSNTRDNLEFGISALRSLRDDVVADFLCDLAQQIEAEIASDYMGQAEQLLREGQTGKYDHVPAAVLAGAVLEKALRTLCNQQSPPIPTLKETGERKTLNPMIDDLKKAGVYTETKAKQLRFWASIRNNAAHGDFDKFDRHQVEQMIEGINQFLGDYLK